jgi:hypothetical protein
MIRTSTVARYVVAGLLLVQVFLAFQGTSLTAQGSPTLEQFPSIFNGRAVIAVVGETPPHGPYNSGGDSNDVLSLVDAISGVASGSTASVLGSRLDVEVMDYPSLEWKADYASQDVISVGDQKRSIVNYKYNSPVAGAWIDDATGNILTVGGGSYSSPDGRHGLISIFTDGSRHVLLISAASGFTVRAAGVILKNYGSYQQVLTGMATVFVPHDDNANDVFDAGEGVTVLATVPAQGASTTTSTTSLGSVTTTSTTSDVFSTSTSSAATTTTVTGDVLVSSSSIPEFPQAIPLLLASLSLALILLRRSSAKGTDKTPLPASY